MFVIIPFCRSFLLQDIPQDYIAIIKAMVSGNQVRYGSSSEFLFMEPWFWSGGEKQEKGEINLCRVHCP